jgi:hypothetical protein
MIQGTAEVQMGEEKETDDHVTDETLIYQAVMSSPRAMAVRSTLMAYFLENDIDEGEAGIANLVARLVGGPPTVYGGGNGGVITYRNEQELWEYLEDKHGYPVNEILTPVLDMTERSGSKFLLKIRETAALARSQRPASTSAILDEAKAQEMEAEKVIADSGIDVGLKDFMETEEMKQLFANREAARMDKKTAEYDTCQRAIINSIETFIRNEYETEELVAALIKAAEGWPPHYKGDKLRGYMTTWARRGKIARQVYAEVRRAHRAAESDDARMDVLSGFIARGAYYAPAARQVGAEVEVRRAIRAAESDDARKDVLLGFIARGAYFASAARKIGAETEVRRAIRACRTDAHGEREKVYDDFELKGAYYSSVVKNMRLERRRAVFFNALFFNDAGGDILLASAVAARDMAAIVLALAPPGTRENLNYRSDETMRNSVVRRMEWRRYRYGQSGGLPRSADAHARLKASSKLDITAVVKFVCTTRFTYFSEHLDNEQSLTNPDCQTPSLRFLKDPHVHSWATLTGCLAGARADMKAGDYSHVRVFDGGGGGCKPSVALLWTAGVEDSGVVGGVLHCGNSFNDDGSSKLNRHVVTVDNAVITIKALIATGRYNQIHLLEVHGA